MYWWQISFLLPGDLSFSYKNCFEIIESTNYVSVSVKGYHMHTIFGLSRWHIATKVKVPKPTILPRSLLNSNLYNKWKSNNNAIQYTSVHYATYRFVCCIFDVASKNDLLPDQHGLIVCTKFWIDEWTAGTSDSIGHSNWFEIFGIFWLMPQSFSMFHSCLIAKMPFRISSMKSRSRWQHSWIFLLPARSCKSRNMY